MGDFGEIREEMVGLDEKAGCSTIADLLISGKKEEIEAFLNDQEAREDKNEL